MKNINPAITSAELNAVQRPRHEIILENSIIRFSDKNTSLVNNSLENIPLTLESLSVGANDCWGVFTVGSNSLIKYLRINQSSDFDLDSSNAGIVQEARFCQRPGMISNGTNAYLFYAEVSTLSNFFQIKRVDVASSKTNPINILSLSPFNFGPQVPFTYAYTTGNQDNNLNRINTIRAVMPVSSGVIVLTGDHNLGKKKIFCNFYYVTTSGYTKLATNFTGDIDDPIKLVGDSAIYSQACAIENNGTIYVFFNTNQSGRAAYFSIRNGVESEVKPVVPIDKEDDTQNFYCNSVTKINNLFFLTGRVSFKNSDGTLTGFDTYLTSENLENWSLGEKNSFICSAEAKGKLIYSTTTGPASQYLYYLGNKYWARALPNYEIAPSASTIFSENITSRVSQFDISQNLNEADSFSFSTNNYDLYFNSGNPGSADLIKLSSGQFSDDIPGGGAVLSQIGLYSIDSTSQAYSVEGIQLKEFQCRDVAMKKINDWQSPIDMWLEGSYQFQSDMKNSDGLIIKSENVDSFGTFTDGASFKYTGLNIPYMTLFDAPYSESSIIKTSVYMTDYSDAYHLSTVGFMLGAYEDADGNFNSLMLLVPRERGGATPYTTLPTLRKLNLAKIDSSDPEKQNTGLKYEQYISSLWRQSAEEVPITTSTAATYEHVSNFRIPKATQTDLMTRLNGRYIEFYSKPRVRTQAGWAQNSEWTLKTVVTVPDDEILYPDRNAYGGVVVSTDVSASKNWFAQGKYGDMVVQLSYATDWNPVNAQGKFTRLFGTGVRSGTSTNSYQIESLSSTELDNLAVGMKVVLHGVSYLTGWYPTIIQEILPTGIRVDFNIPPVYQQNGFTAVWVPSPSNPNDYNSPWENPGGPGSYGSWQLNANYQTVYQYEIEIYGLSGYDDINNLDIPAESTYFGEISSQAKSTAINNSSSYVNIETGATKKANIIEGRGAIVTSDSTAMSIRHFESDGITHRLKSGDTGAGKTYMGFDATSPLINTNKWKFVMYHGKFFDGTPESKGCKADGYVIVENEIIKYVNYASLKRGYYPNDPPAYNTVTICPAAYAPVQDAAVNATYLYNWKSWGGSQPGDQFDQFQNTFGFSPVGMLVEVLSKNVSDDNTENGNSNYYVKSVVASTQNSTSGIELSTPLKTRLTGPITNIDNPNDPYWSVEANRNQAPEGDMVVVSGRAQFNTEKQKHNETTPVRYYPCDSSGNSPYIQILSTEYYQGGAFTVEDMLKKIINMAGVRNVKARTSFDNTVASSALTYTVTSTPVSLGLQENMEDFTLEGEFYIPGNNIASGQVSNRNQLNIFFRNKYYIAIEQYVTAADYNAGYQGTLYIRLATNQTSINAFDSERTLEGIKIRNKTSFSGAYSGATPVTNATLTPDLTKKTKIKISVNKKFISVEINNKPMMSFCIEEYKFADNTNLSFYESGPIQISSKTTISENTASVRVLGLGDQASGYAIRRDSSAKSAIDEILENRHAFMRTTEDGSVELGQFWNRDVFGNLHTFIVQDNEQNAKEQIVGHIAYKSDKIISNWIDEDWVIQNGYRYVSESGISVENSYYALREAKLAIRRQKEQSFTRDIEALPRLALQPEDEVDISHPNLPSGRYIINNISFIAKDSSSMSASYSVRKKAI